MKNKNQKIQTCDSSEHTDAFVYALSKIFIF